MAAFDIYAGKANGSHSEAERIGLLLGLDAAPLDDITLADRIASGLPPATADALGRVLGGRRVLAQIVPAASLRRARQSDTAMSREISARLYTMARVIDALGMTFHGDAEAITRFLLSPHPLLAGRTPFDMTRSSVAGAEVVLNLLRRAQNSFPA